MKDDPPLSDVLATAKRVQHMLSYVKELWKTDKVEEVVKAIEMIPVDKSGEKFRGPSAPMETDWSQSGAQKKRAAGGKGPDVVFNKGEKNAGSHNLAVFDAGRVFISGIVKEGVE
ncbi:hypothetical protein NDU88_006828 [Pleurodeles waltl]|uniref:Uncharacterized protein n=1 Tax=Pleurodeles waltl TaxID=8319 RepID=A0AAV7UQ65_PLEWA|nr:hypothetical protein NDU88_006828 [Pleurodeles waltl]